MNDAIAFKTRMTGLTTVPIDPNHLDQLDGALGEKMRAAPKDFFKAAPFIADLQAVSILTLAQLQTIKQTFANHGLLLVGLTNHTLDTDLLTQAGLANIANPQDIPLAQSHSHSPSADAPATSMQMRQTSKNGAKSAFETDSPKQRTETSESAKSSLSPSVSSSASTLTSPETSTSTSPAAKTQVITRHIRSGQRLYAPEGDLVIIGTVGAGAEVIADGNIFILGSLRGRAFAGAKGSSNAFIYAQALNAELISIAGNYQTMEQLDAHKNGTNVLITLREDETMQIKTL